MEKRLFHRIPFSAPARLTQGEEFWDTRLIDLSLHGALVEYPTDFEGDLHIPFHLEFFLETADRDIKLEGHIVHSANDRLGFAVDNMDIQSATELRKVISFNLGDEALLQHDLKSLVSH